MTNNNSKQEDLYQQDGLIDLTDDQASLDTITGGSRIGDTATAGAIIAAPVVAAVGGGGTIGYIVGGMAGGGTKVNPDVKKVDRDAKIGAGVGAGIGAAGLAGLAGIIAHAARK